MSKDNWACFGFGVFLLAAGIGGYYESWWLSLVIFGVGAIIEGVCKRNDKRDS